LNKKLTVILFKLNEAVKDSSTAGRQNQTSLESEKSIIILEIKNHVNYIKETLGETSVQD
jgi:hypothetical protein